MTDFSEALVRRMNEAARDLSSPVVRPKDAATLILVDRSGSRPKVLLGRRHANHKFMPGKFVFPGGRVEAVDRRMANATHLDPQVEDRLMRAVVRPNARHARARSNPRDLRRNRTAARAAQKCPARRRCDDERRLGDVCTPGRASRFCQY